MGDIFGRIVGILIGVSLLFLLPILYFAERQEMVEQLYLITETADFVDTVRTTGRLTEENYELFLARLSDLPNRYEVKMTGRHKRIELTGGELLLHNEEFYENQIVEVLKEEGAYVFSRGDFFKVEIVKLSGGVLEIFRKSLIPINENGVVSAYYGGMIGYDGS